MKYGMKKPCNNCPFVRRHNFHLTPERVEELRDNTGEFPCHQTVDYDQAMDDDEGYDGVVRRDRDQSQEVHCLGHLIVQWSDWGGFNKIQAWSARLGEFSPEDMPTCEEADVYETWEEMIERCRELDGRPKATVGEHMEEQG